jgi:uncharacterized protein DUF6719
MVAARMLSEAAFGGSHMKLLFATGLFGLATAAFTFDLAVAEMLKREPEMGALREGQRVLVDDGTCGPGKVKEVIGGNHVKVGGTKNIVRQRRCIPKP